MAEKRLNNRRKVRWTVMVEPGHLTCPTQDVSESGMFLISRKVLGAGTPVQLQLMAKGSDDCAFARAVVRRQKRVQPSMMQAQRGGFGVEFTWVSPEVEQQLATL